MVTYDLDTSYGIENSSILYNTLYETYDSVMHTLQFIDYMWPNCIVYVYWTLRTAAQALLLTNLILCDFITLPLAASLLCSTGQCRTVNSKDRMLKLYHGIGDQSQSMKMLSNYYPKSCPQYIHLTICRHANHLQRKIVQRITQNLHQICSLREYMEYSGPEGNIQVNLH